MVPVWDYPRFAVRGPRAKRPRDTHTGIAGSESGRLRMFLRFGESAGLVHPGIMGQNGPLAMNNFKPWLNGEGTERSGAGQARPRSSGTGRLCLVREPETPNWRWT